MDAYVSAMSRVEEALAHGVASIARASARRPRATIALFVMLSLGLTAGLAVVEMEFSARELWVDQNSVPMQNLRFLEATFGTEDRLEVFTITAKAGNNVIAYDVMEDVFALHELVVGIETNAGNTYDELCARDAGGNCVMLGALRFWGFDEATFVAQESNDTSVGTTCLAQTYPDFGVVQRDIDFGRFAEVGGVATALGLVIEYNLVSDFEGSDAEQLEWEQNLLDVVFDLELASTTVNLLSERSIDDELARSIGGDILLLIIAYILMIIFVSLTLGRTCSRLNGRALLATADIFAIIFSTGAAYGTMALLGVKFTSLVQILPFILVGVGADNMFVIVAAFDRTDKRRSVDQRIYDAMHDAGVSVTVTSMTDFAAFMLTSFNKLEALVWFGQYAGLAILFIYFAHLTVFPAMLALDEYRIQARRSDLVPCCRVPAAVAAEADANDITDAKQGAHQHDSVLSRFFRDRYAPFLLKPSVKAFVLIFFCALTAIGAWQSTTISTDFSLRLLAPDDSYLQDTWDDLEAFFDGTIDNAATAGLFFKTVQYGDFAVQTEIRRLATAVLAADSVDTAKGLVDWHAAFTSWVQLEPAFNSSLDAGTSTYLVGSAESFAAAVQTWLLVPAFAPFAGAIIFSDDNTVISVSAFSFFLVNTESSFDDVDALEELEAIAESSFLGDDAIIAAFRFIFFDQYRIIIAETLTTVALAVLAVTVLAALLLVHPLAVLICAVTLTMTFICLLGSLPLVLDLSLNSVTTVNLIMSIGILVDFQVHFLHMAGSINPAQFVTRDERVTEALHRIGPAVLLGVTTTFLGVVPLAAAGSAVFRTFFQIFFVIVILGGSFGLIFAPVVYSLIGPAIHRKRFESSHSVASNQSNAQNEVQPT